MPPRPISVSLYSNSVALGTQMFLKVKSSRVRETGCQAACTSV